MGTLSYMPGVTLYGEFLLHAVYCFRYLSCIPCAILGRDFVLHALCYFMCGVSLICLVLFYTGSFSYMLHAILCGVFLL